MPLICPVCSRPNPDEALYCYHDGANLPGAAPREGPVAVGSQPFRSPFFLPSGGICRNFDELVLACEERWEEARDLLREELLAGFFSGLGRTDLAFAAQRAAAEPDVDVGLDRLLAELPGGVRLPARLGVRPAEINLGRVGRGEDHQLVVRIQNEGMGLLRGSASCGHVNWLVFGDEAGAPHKVFQCRHDLALTMRVIGKRLRAGSHPQEALLQIETNGGTAVVVVRVEAPAVAPFTDGVLAGAESPRQLAEKTRAAPREAAPLFENGAVAAWYEANGWTYPVRGPKATGVAGVQQFFECLAWPPRRAWNWTGNTSIWKGRPAPRWKPPWSFRRANTGPSSPTPSPPTRGSPSAAPSSAAARRGFRCGSLLCRCGPANNWSARCE